VVVLGRGGRGGGVVGAGRARWWLCWGEEGAVVVGVVSEGLVWFYFVSTGL